MFIVDSRKTLFWSFVSIMVNLTPNQFILIATAVSLSMSMVNPNLLTMRLVKFILVILLLKIKEVVMEFGLVVNQMKEKLQVVRKGLTNLLIIQVMMPKNTSMTAIWGILVITGREWKRDRPRLILNFMADIVVISENPKPIYQWILVNRNKL